MNKKDYIDYIQDIFKSIKEVEDFTNGFSYNEFVQDNKTINATIRSLEVIGEATKKIPDSIRDDYPQIPWKLMAGMRDKLIHEYSGVDLKIVWETLQNDIPKIRPLIKRVKKDLKG